LFDFTVSASPLILTENPIFPTTSKGHRTCHEDHKVSVPGVGDLPGPSNRRCRQKKKPLPGRHLVLASKQQRSHVSIDHGTLGDRLNTEGTAFKLHLKHDNFDR